MLTTTLAETVPGDKAPQLGLLDRHLSEPRMQPYLRATGGDRGRALALYEWNSRLAGAFLIDLGHLEVALRNAIDARMLARHLDRGLSGSWLDDAAGEIGRDLAGRRHRQPFLDIESARRRVQRNRKPLTPGQILSETSFGLWHQLVSRRHTNLWPDVARAFPHAPDRARETVAEPVARLRELRNRIGHHHRIWTLPCAQLHADLLGLAGYVDPALRNWIAETSSVVDELERSPLRQVSGWDQTGEPGVL